MDQVKKNSSKHQITIIGKVHFFIIIVLKIPISGPIYLSCRVVIFK